MLDKEAPNPEDQRRLFGIIRREMDRLTKLTNDFLSFARPVQGAPALLNLPALVEDHLQIFGRNPRPGLRLERRLGPVPPVFFDRDHFSQIVWNLLKNAVEAGARRESLVIGVEIGLEPDWPNHVTFKVTNDGPPISPENLPRLFKPFFTTKSTGHGLGLATISRLLTEGGGDITVQSDPSGLTSFSVYLPMAPARPA
jgi:two-component system sensor histidine kinase PilS (NtrC family)